MKELPREEGGRRAERCREGGEWSAETLKWRREGDGRVGGRGLSPFSVFSVFVNYAGIRAALDAAHILNSSLAEQHSVKRSRAANPRNLLEKFGNLILHKFQKPAPARPDTIRVRQQFKIRTRDRDILLRRRNTCGRLVR